MLERVSLCSAARRLEELPQNDHRSVRLSRSAGPGDDDGLGVARLALQPDHLLHHPVQLGALLAVPRRAERQRVADVAVRVHGQHDGAHVGLEEQRVEHGTHMLLTLVRTQRSCTCVGKD